MGYLNQNWPVSVSPTDGVYKAVLLLEQLNSFNCLFFNYTGVSWQPQMQNYWQMILEQKLNYNIEQKISVYYIVIIVEYQILL